jgi:hypothetical protein
MALQVSQQCAEPPNSVVIALAQLKGGIGKPLWRLPSPARAII